MVAVLRSAWVHDTSGDMQWCRLVDDGLMGARFVNRSQVQVSGRGCLCQLGLVIRFRSANTPITPLSLQHGIVGGTLQDYAVQIVEVADKNQKECSCKHEENLDFVSFTGKNRECYADTY